MKIQYQGTGFFLKAGIFAVALAWGGELLAHEAHDNEILRLDEQLQRLNSTSHEAVNARLRRADLHRREQSWTDALTDYEAVVAIQPDNPGALLGLAQLYLDQTEFKKALRWSAQLLKQRPEHIRALLLQARAQSGLGNMQLASDLYARAIEHMEAPNPEHYLEHATAVLLTHSDSAVIDAIAIIDAGTERLNHPVSLHGFALEQELQFEKFSNAIERIDRVIALYPRLWSWHLKRAELLVSIDRIDEACIALNGVANDLEKLPPQRNQTPAIQSIGSSIAKLQQKCSSE